MYLLCVGGGNEFSIIQQTTALMNKNFNRLTITCHFKNVAEIRNLCNPVACKLIENKYQSINTTSETFICFWALTTHTHTHDQLNPSYPSVCQRRHFAIEIFVNKQLISTIQSWLVDDCP